MVVKPESFKNLVAVRNGKVVKIPNMVLRKPSNINVQNAHLAKGSVCIVCNFCFHEKKIDWSSNIKAICHPFRDDDIFPSSIKTHLFSESDFCDKFITPHSHNMEKWDGKYDFVYFFLSSSQGVRSKGLYMAPMIGRVAKRLGLKGLMIGYQGSKSNKLRGTIFDKAYRKVMTEINEIDNMKFIYKKFSTKEVCAIMRGSKFVLYPNTADASPRLLTEAIVRGVPVVVNKDIYGGWKYINNRNGSFFDGLSIEEYVDDKDTGENEESLMHSISKVLSIDRGGVSNTFYEKYGFKNSAVKFASIINRISSTNYDAVVFAEWQPVLKRVARKSRWI